MPKQYKCQWLHCQNPPLGPKASVKAFGLEQGSSGNVPKTKSIITMIPLPQKVDVSLITSVQCALTTLCNSMPCCAIAQQCAIALSQDSKDME